MPKAIKPVVYPADLLVADVQQPPGARVEKLPTHRSADRVAAGNAASAASQRAENGRDQVQVPFVYQEAAASEQELIRHGQADDAEDQQGEDGYVAVGINPLKNIQEERIAVAQACLPVKSRQRLADRFFRARDDRSALARHNREELDKAFLPFGGRLDISFRVHD